MMGFYRNPVGRTPRSAIGVKIMPISRDELRPAQWRFELGASAERLTVEVIWFTPAPFRTDLSPSGPTFYSRGTESPGTELGVLRLTLVSDQFAAAVSEDG